MQLNREKLVIVKQILKIHFSYKHFKDTSQKNYLYPTIFQIQKKKKKNVGTRDAQAMHKQILQFRQHDLDGRLAEIRNLVITGGVKSFPQDVKTQSLTDFALMASTILPDEHASLRKSEILFELKMKLGSEHL